MELSLPGLWRPWRGYHHGIEISDTVFPVLPASVLTILPDSTMVANPSTFSLPVCWGTLTQAHTISLACPVSLLQQQRDQHFENVFFKASQDNRALLLWLRSLAGLQTDGECNLSPQRPERCWDSGKTCCTPGPPRAPWCEWTCFSSCLCATDFADGSVCSFYLWSMQKFTAEAMNWDLCCLDTHKESWEKTINSIFLPRFFKTNPDPFIYCPKCIPCHFFFKWSPYLL